MSTSDVWIAAIRAREQAATKGPWTSEGGGEGVGAADLADAEFIAHARADIPALLAAVDEARAQLARILDAWDAARAAPDVWDALDHLDIAWCDVGAAIAAAREAQVISEAEAP